MALKSISPCAHAAGPARKIFIEFLERSCTAEFSGFLLYKLVKSTVCPSSLSRKELGRRLKKTNPAVAEIFTLMSRDEARHAGFLNKLRVVLCNIASVCEELGSYSESEYWINDCAACWAMPMLDWAMSDFNLALDLGFLTRNRKYTFFKPKFIFYATFLSEKIGYWRYITIYRHLQRNPENQMYPLFEYFENWCQDENRCVQMTINVMPACPHGLSSAWHGDFFSAVLKAQPKFLNDWKAKLWSRFFCLSVYITMYLNDHQRTAFYESLGMNTRHFNQHVIIETNKSVARLFPQVPDCEHPEFFERMNKLVDLNQKVADIGKMDVPSPIKAVLRAPLIERMLKEITQIYFSAPMRSGTVDLNPALQSVY
eukprot:scaffold273084_cov17-Tisochrysis_lutea.AAC.1